MAETDGAFVDATPPAVSNVVVTENNASSFTVSCNYSDNVETAKVQLVAYVHGDSVNDIVRYDAVLYDGVASAKIDISNHGNRADCYYRVEVFATDTAGNTADIYSNGYYLDYYMDITPPVVNDVNVTNVTATGYTVTVSAVDNGTVTKFLFPTWSEVEQDDITWHSVTAVNGTAEYSVNIVDHNNDSGWYRTDVYAYDACGNISTAKSCWAYVDVTPPIISNVEIINQSKDGYTVRCTVTDDGEVDRVQFPTWTENNGQDDIDPSWEDSAFSRGILLADGMWYYTVNVNDRHNSEVDCYYITHIYAFDRCGNSSSAETAAFVDATPPVITSIITSDVTPTGYTITATAADSGTITEFMFPTWSDPEQDDITWHRVPAVNGSAEYRVNIVDHNNEPGWYRTDVYAYDACGNQSGMLFRSVFIDLDYSKLMTMILPASMKTVDSAAFDGIAAEVIVIPEGCVSVASDAFGHCPNLKYVVNHSSVTIVPPAGVKVLNE